MLRNRIYFLLEIEKINSFLILNVLYSSTNNSFEISLMLTTEISNAKVIILTRLTFLFVKINIQCLLVVTKEICE